MTPITTVMSSCEAGAEMMTFLAPASTWARALVASVKKPVDSMTMSTLNADGTIHSVAMWYGFVDGAIGFETKAKGQKVVNLRRNPNITCLVEDGESYEELRGVSLVGTAEIIDDLKRIGDLGFKRIIVRYRGSGDLKSQIDRFVTDIAPKV